MRRRAFDVAVGIIVVKERIQQFYRRQASEERELNEFKRKHGYCSGRPFCMKMVPSDKHSCPECLKANANPKYSKVISEYGKMRREERFQEKQDKEAKKVAKARKRAA